MGQGSSRYTLEIPVAIGYLRNSGTDPLEKQLYPLGPTASQRRSVHISVMTKNKKNLVDFSGSMHALSTFDRTNYSLHCSGSLATH